MGNSAGQERSTQRVALLLEYDGSGYSGWQRQSSPEQLTVQAKVESALSKIVDKETSVYCAGRTDSGVHATGQLVHFETPIDRGVKAWVKGTNSLLPGSIRIKWAGNVSDEFHARFSATSRRYLYLIHETKIPTAYLSKLVTHVPFELDVDAMHSAAQHLLGERDFSSFRAAGCQSRTPWRCIEHLNVSRCRGFIVIDIQANAFLQHMVRNITGMLFSIGKGEHAPDWAAELLQAQDRTAAPMTAPAEGLYLVRVGYPDGFGLPKTALGPVFLHPYP